MIDPANEDFFPNEGKAHIIVMPSGNIEARIAEQKGGSKPADPMARESADAMDRMKNSAAIEIVETFRAAEKKLSVGEPKARAMNKVVMLNAIMIVVIVDLFCSGVNAADPFVCTYPYQTVPVFHYFLNCAVLQTIPFRERQKLKAFFIEQAQPSAKGSNPDKSATVFQ